MFIEGEGDGINSRLSYEVFSTLLFISILGFTDIVGITRRTDAEIKAFNQDFIKNNPTYNVLMSNCQDYVNALTNFLMTEGERKGWLPETETYRQ